MLGEQARSTLCSKEGIEALLSTWLDSASSTSCPSPAAQRCGRIPGQRQHHLPRKARHPECRRRREGGGKRHASKEVHSDPLRRKCLARPTAWHQAPFERSSRRCPLWACSSGWRARRIPWEDGAELPWTKSCGPACSVHGAREHGSEDARPSPPSLSRSQGRALEHFSTQDIFRCGKRTLTLLWLWLYSRP